MKITKKTLLKLIKEQISKDESSDFDEAMFKANDEAKKEFELASFDERDDFTNFEQLVEKYLKRKLTSKEKQDFEYRRLIQMHDKICSAIDDVSYQYRVKGKDGKKAEAKVYSLIDKF